MDIVFFLIILAVLVGGLAALFFYLRSERRIDETKSQSADSLLLLLQNQIQEINRAVDSKLGQSTEMMQRQFSESSRLIREITQELTKVGESQKQVVDVAKQLENLQDILKNPKQRGVLGEYFLKTVLENILPPGTFQMQYEFKDGSIVDAAIFVKDKIIPVDSKFSLENYTRILEARTDEERERMEIAFKNDLKARIDETAKYIKPEEGTMDFAFMFIPAEAVYYDLLINKIGAVKSTTRDLIQYAAGEKKVMIVSPTTFLAYLQTVLQGLKALQIEESAKEIRQRVEELGRHLSSYETYMKKLGTHLGTAVGMYNSAYKELGKIDKDVMRITGAAAGFEPMTLEKPSAEDGVVALPIILLIGGIVMEIALAGVFIIYFVSQSGIGLKISDEALMAARSGIQDGLMQLLRNKSFSSTTGYNITIGSRSATVIVCRDSITTNINCDTVNVNKDEITSTGAALLKKRTLRAVVNINSTTGEVKIESIKEI